MRDLGLYRDMSENTENYNVFNTKINHFVHLINKGRKCICVLSDCQKARFYTFFKNAEGLGKRLVSKFAKANSSHKWLSAYLGGTKFPDWNPQ